MREVVSLYSWRYARTLVYMLQSTEYQVWPYLKWYWRVWDFNTVMYRRTLVVSRPVRLLLSVLYAGMVLQLMVGVVLMAGWWLYGWPVWHFGLALAASYPIVWAHLVILPLVLGSIFIIKPKHRRAIRQSEQLFAAHPGIKLAVAGSYGKTTMKELLVTVLSEAETEDVSEAESDDKGGTRSEDTSEAKKVAATQANKNVALSHARFARTLAGDEDVVIIEYGEGRPGDVTRFARRTHPTHAVITGLAPVHLDRYKTLDAAARDIFSVNQFVDPAHIFVNADSADTAKYRTKHMRTYSSQSALGWKISRVKLSTTGTSFTMSKPEASKDKGKSRAKQRLKLTSGLLGRHQVGPLAFAAAFAMELGLSEQQVAAGVAKTQPFEHRMQPYRINGAWVIDDTYNGNLEGVSAGTALLRDLPAKRKWYITPGLVDQGRDTARIHRHVGEFIAAAKPDTVVLMNNSAAEFIIAGLHAAEYKGELRIEADPLHFYTNLHRFIAAGDLVLMQNDWTDNYT